MASSTSATRLLWLGYLCFFSLYGNQVTAVSPPIRDSRHGIIGNGKRHISKRLSSSKLALEFRGGSSSSASDSMSSGVSLSISSSTPRNIIQLVLGVIGGYISYQFASTFPFLVTPKAAKLTYVRANYGYDDPRSVFCQSPLTYLTDYAVLVVLCILWYRIQNYDGIQPSSTTMVKSNSDKNNNQESTIQGFRSIRYRSCLLLAMYAIQFFGGGMAHAHLDTTTTKNRFRVLWTVVVGAVAVSGGIIGALATSTLQLSETTGGKRISNYVPSDFFWIGYSLLLAVFTILGRLSYLRPAVDTFVAGTSQALPTFYLMGVILRQWRETQKQEGKKKESTSSLNIPTSTCLGVFLGFGLNSALLPSYALAVQYTNISTGMLNFFLHSW
eukprot:CAMPEP_0194200616 /NCGR_PEP_ID=MMETSP0156-20130528/1138_1 /TAXON_ID=33649 /ORGANISM="Thalassionema nitzschioides, Strain L26-B" /LENGTH=384 /DNA_ID=CAMNT_0038925629 /DNA_START=65 /DNA_END=1216 /DNA_ORIENTATION=+